MNILLKNRFKFSLIPDVSFTSGNLTTKDFQANSRVQKNGIMTKSSVLIPAGTQYKVFRKRHNPDGSVTFSVEYKLEGRIPHASDFTYESREKAIEDGWNI